MTSSEYPSRYLTRKSFKSGSRRIYIRDASLCLIPVLSMGLGCGYVSRGDGGGMGRSSSVRKVRKKMWRVWITGSGVVEIWVRWLAGGVQDGLSAVSCRGRIWGSLISRKLAFDQKRQYSGKIMKQQEGQHDDRRQDGCEESRYCDVVYVMDGGWKREVEVVALDR